MSNQRWTKDKNDLQTENGRTLVLDPILYQNLEKFLTDPEGPYMFGETRFNSHYPLSKEVCLEFHQYCFQKDLPYDNTQGLSPYTFNAYVSDIFPFLTRVKSAGTRIKGLIPNPNAYEKDTRPRLGIPGGHGPARRLLYSLGVHDIGDLEERYAIRPSVLKELTFLHFLPKDHLHTDEILSRAYSKDEVDLYILLRIWLMSSETPYYRTSTYAAESMDPSLFPDIQEIRSSYMRAYPDRAVDDHLTDSRVERLIKVMTGNVDNDYNFIGLVRKD